MLKIVACSELNNINIYVFIAISSSNTNILAKNNFLSHPTIYCRQTIIIVIFIKKRDSKNIEFKQI